MQELHKFCREGRIYDVERWIQAGQPLQLPAGSPIDRRRRFRTALEIAFDRQDHALMLLLFANGYDLAAEPECPLDVALRLRRRDLLDLLLEWGADPQQMSVDALCETYDSELYERFRGLGIDLTSGHAMAYALGYHTSNKPLFGFAKRHRLNEPRVQTELDIALAHHAGEGSEKGVLLCLWAGADAHTPVPYLEYLHLAEDEDEDEGYTAVYRACSHGYAEILERLGPNPAQDNYDALYGGAPNEKVVGVLARSILPTDPSRVVMAQLARSAWPFRNHRPVDTLRALFEAGVRWKAGSTQEIAETRRDLLRAGDSTFLRLMELLATDDHCSQEILAELARTPSMRKRMKKVGLIPQTEKERSKFDRARPTKKVRKTLAKFGITEPKPKIETPTIPRTARIGKWSRDGRVLRLDRSALYERVWAAPVERLAKEWAMSGRGLAKACRRLRVPVPPRGYWAKVAAGQRVRRPRLPTLPPGQGEEILIHLPEPIDAEQ